MLRRTAIIGCTALGALLLPLTAGAAAAEPPTIDSVTEHDVSAHAATVEATIDPRGAETEYSIFLECEAAYAVGPCEPVAAPQHVEGAIAPGAPQTVSDHLKGLHEGYGYEFAIVAQNSAGVTESRGHMLFVPNTPRSFCPYGCSVQESPEQQARVEQAAREAQAQREREAREREQHGSAVLGTTTDTPPPRCVVPGLRGDTLAAARRALARAHCKLGRVTRRRPRRGRLHVVRQSHRRGQSLPAGGAVAVTLGR